MNLLGQQGGNPQFSNTQANGPMPGINSAYMGNAKNEGIVSGLNSLEMIMNSKTKPKNPQAGTPLGKSSFLGSGGAQQGMMNSNQSLGRK